MAEHRWKVYGGKTYVPRTLKCKRCELMIVGIRAKVVDGRIEDGGPYATRGPKAPQVGDPIFITFYNRHARPGMGEGWRFASQPRELKTCDEEIVDGVHDL